ncbi:MAG: NPCBM/NEW2 domain-containing protein [Sedimentisphaerales bacterium]|nr:NPCBM/NEW2 domain-containing protein [Sedimentisphaerales bacterium]
MRLFNFTICRVCNLLHTRFLITLFLVASVQAGDAPTSSNWHVKNAPVRFRIEKDDDRSLIPEVSLLDLTSDIKSESVQNWIKENRWSEKRQFQGKLCQNCLPAFGSNGFKCNLNRDFTHFVARAGIYDSTDPNTVLHFEVYADERRIFRSKSITRRNPIVEVNAGIPPRSKELKLVVVTDEGRFRNRARWIDPGFLSRGHYPSVSFARIYAPGYDVSNFIPEVYATTSGDKVKSRIFSAAPGEAMEILFESPVGNPSYLVYLVPKGRGGESNSSWQPEAGLVLETRWSRKGLKDSDRLPQLKAIFDHAKPVGRSFVDDIQQTFPIHIPAEYDGGAPLEKGGYGFYRYSGCIDVPKKGSYTFATISNRDSYITIDGKEVVGWPGKHDYHEGRRGEKKGSISLEPGVHKLEYYNYHHWGEMFTVAVWKKPGEELRSMSRTDFIPLGWYKTTSAEFKNSDKAYAAFEWSVVDAFRLEQFGPSFVTMRFKPIRPERLTRYDYRWTFDDGTVATEEIVDHVFLRPAIRNVKLDLSLAGEHLASTTHDVHVHPAWDQCLTYIDNIDDYDNVIKQRALDKAPPDDLVNLYALAQDAERPDWKNRAATVLAEHVDRLVRESENTDFIFDFGQSLCSPGLKEYDKALRLFTQLLDKSGVDQRTTRRSAICLAEVLITYFGRNEEALKLLDQLQIQNDSSDWQRRAIIAKAQAMLALGQRIEAIDLVQSLGGSSNPADAAKQTIKHAGLMRHARFLMGIEDDPNQLDHAMANLETIIAEDPMKVFSPTLNLIKLDVHLARDEFQAAYHVTERLRQLQLNDFDIAQVLARQVIALCGLKDLNKAKSTYAILNKDYPYSPAVTQARQAIIQAIAQK